MTLAVDIDPAAAPRDFHRRWPTLQPPLRPAPEAVSAVETWLAEAADPLLLMGVTPELAAINRVIIAMDWSPAMIACAWPGDSTTRRVIEGDWKAMPLADGAVGGAFGDAVLTMLDWPDDASLVLAELWRVVRSGGRVVLRCLATPADPPTTEQLRRALATPGGMAFHEWRLRVNMAAAAAGGIATITSDRLWQWYERHWPDRRNLAIIHGWPDEALPEIEAYRGSTYLHSYPSREAIACLVRHHWAGPMRLVETGGYPGAELCPLLVLERP